MNNKYAGKNIEENGYGSTNGSNTSIFNVKYLWLSVCFLQLHPNDS